MNKKNYYCSVLAIVMVAVLCIGFTACGGDDGGGGNSSSNLVVSPFQIQLTSEKDAKGSFTITTNEEWSISNIPQWLTLSALSGQGTTTITVTAADENRNDEKRSAVIRVTAGSVSKDVTVDQLPAYTAGCRISVGNELILSNGFYADLTFDKDVYGYVEGYYYASILKTKTEKELYEEVKSSSGAVAKDYNFAISSLPSASTDYIYCVIGYDKNHNFGPMTIHNFTTKSNSTTSDASIGTVSYSSTYWTYTITMQSRCHHFYRLIATNSYAEAYYSYPDIMLAYFIRERIADPNYPDYDYSINGGTMRTNRESTDTAFLVWTWGVNDKDEFSGNIRSAYRNLSSSAPLNVDVVNASEEFLRFTKPTRRELDDMKKNFSVICENY